MDSAEIIQFLFWGFLAGISFSFITLYTVIFGTRVDCNHKWGKWIQNGNTQGRKCTKCDYFQLEEIKNEVPN